MVHPTINSPEPLNAQSEEANPLVSVILPVRNEVRFIEQTLNAVFDQDYPAEKLEILIADGVSTDGTRALIEQLQQRHPNLFLLDNPGGIVPTGMNIAIRQARGEIIVRVDGHTLIAPDYVRQCVRALQTTSAQNVGGKMLASGKSAFGEAVAAATSSRFGVGGSRFHYSDQEEWVDSVYMGAWRADTFRWMGLFDEELVRDQDDELNYRLSKLGGRILLSPHIRSVYTVRSTPRGLWRQYFQYGFWKVRVMQKHPRQMSLRQFVPPAFAAALIGGTLAALLVPYGWVLLAATAGSYAAANLAASGWVASQRGWRLLPLLPLAFGILHLAYGMGFLAGLVRFAGRWKAERQPAEAEG